MPDDTSQASRSEKATAHLARIRDNQRRSRARRKEYLTELEDKFRRCEQAGVEASAEMQQAAREVLEENARLRAFLREKGHSDQELEAFTSRMTSGVNDFSLDHTTMEGSPMSSAVFGLENLLRPRNPYGSSSPSRTGSQSRSPSAHDSRIYEQPNQPMVPGLVPVPSNPQTSRYQTRLTSPHSQIRPGRPTTSGLPRRYSSEQSRQYLSQPNTEIPLAGIQAPSTVDDFLEEQSACSFVSAGYPNVDTYATGFLDGIEPLHSATHEVRPAQRNFNQRPSNAQMTPLRSASTSSSGYLMPAFETSFSYEQQMHHLPRTSSMSSSVSRVNDGLPLQPALPSPSSYYVDANSHHQHAVDEVSELLLNTELQAQFLRGLGGQQDFASYEHYMSTFEPVDPNSNSNESVEDNFQWPTDADQQEVRRFW